MLNTTSRPASHSSNRQTSPQLDKSEMVFPEARRKSAKSISTIPTGAQSQTNYTISSAASSIRRSPSISNVTPITPVSSNTNRYSFGEYHFPSAGIAPAAGCNTSSIHPTNVAPSPEHIIDLMEREQDAIVLKLMKEIEMLKHENKSLRSMVMSTGSSISSSGGSSIASQGSQQHNGIRRSSSINSNHRASNSISSLSSVSSQHSHNTSSNSTNSNTNKRNSSLFNNYSIAPNPSSGYLQDEFATKLHKPASGDLKEVSPTTKLAAASSRSQSRSRTGSMSNYDLAIEENKFLKVELKRLRSELDSLKK